MGFLGRYHSDAVVLEGAFPPFPHDLTIVPGRDVEATLQSMRGSTMGSVPLLIGDPDDASRLIEYLSLCEEEPEEILADAHLFDPLDLLAERAFAEPQIYDAEVGAWPEADDPLLQLKLSTRLVQGRFKSVVAIAKIPTGCPTELPAFLGFGGWHRCPAPSEQVALARRWHERWGARIIAMGSDQLEFAVDRPPATRTEALELAREFHLYCPDMVDSYDGTLAGFAAVLCRAPYWSFYWD